MNVQTNTQPTAQDFQSHLDSFVAKCQTIIDVHYKDSTMHPKLEAKHGSKFVKIIANETGQTGGRVHCFVDKTNGDVLKAASWQAPAKHARGNIFDNHNGILNMGPYGAAYLRGY